MKNETVERIREARREIWAAYDESEPNKFWQSLKEKEQALKAKGLKFASDKKPKWNRPNKAA